MSNRIGRIEAGPALVYLVRRFGYSAYGSDRDKQVCQYYLPTPMSGLYISISIGGASAYLQESGSTEEVRQALFELYRDNRELAEGDALPPICEAYKTAVADLLKPVFARDVAINILGRAGHLVQYDEERDELINVADHAPSAGYGVPECWLQHPNEVLDFLNEAQGDDPAAFWKAREKGA